MAEDKLYNIHEAATFLNMGHRSVRRLVQRGFLPAHLDGGSYIFRERDLEKVKAQKYPHGMTHGDIGHEYGKRRTTVHAAFKRLGVVPLGTHKGKNNARVYDPKTVQTFARLLGWQLLSHKNQTDELAPHVDGIPRSNGEPSHDLPHADHLSDTTDNEGQSLSSA